MSYLDRPAPAKWPPWAHNSLGVPVHDALRAWWGIPVLRRSSGAAGALLEACWRPAGHSASTHSDRWRARASVLDEAVPQPPGSRPQKWPMWSSSSGLMQPNAALTVVAQRYGRPDRIAPPANTSG